MSTPRESIQPQAPMKAGPAAARSFGRAANWTVGIAAAMLVLTSVGGYFYHREQLSAIAAEHLRLIVTGPSRLQAGVTAEYTVHTTSIGSLAVPAQIEVTLLGPDGKRLKAHKEPADEHGRLSVSIPGDLQIPPQMKLEVVASYRDSREEAEMPIAVDTLAVRSPSEMSPKQEHNFFTPADQSLASNAGPETAGKSQDKATPADPGMIEVTFYPEGGQLAANLENRVYFAARNSSGEPVQLSGAIVAKGRSKNGREIEVASVLTMFDGLGTFSLTPLAGETYRLKITSPKGTKVEPALPEASAERAVVLSTGSGVFGAEKPLEFNIRAAKGDLPLVAAAYCRGVQVGQQPLVTKEGANAVAISLDRAIGGVVRLGVYDYGTSPPTLVANRLVYRRPANKLDVRVSGVKSRYAPGENVDLALSVTNEKGQPVPAVLSAAVIDGVRLGLRLNGAATLFPRSLLADEVADPEDLEDVNFFLSDKAVQSPPAVHSAAKNGVPAAVALDLLLGTQDQCKFAQEPPAMFDNLSRIRSNYEKSLADYRADRTEALNTLTTASFFGGLGLVLLVAMLGVMRIVSGMHLWVAAVGATTCCLIIGAILIDPGRLAANQGIAVGFSSYWVSRDRVPAPAPAQDGCVVVDHVVRQDTKHEIDKPLFWNPLLVADSNGKASIRFKLPQVAKTFRLTVDAHGQQRSGFVQAEIVVRDKH